MNTKNIFMITGVIAVAAVVSYGLYRLTGGGALRADSDTAERATASVSGGNGSHIVALMTNHGVIQFETYDTDAPTTAENFLKLSEQGFYNNLTFHRIIKGFMIQGGDPSGNGTSGPGYTFADELNPETASYKAGYKKGVVAMANAGPNTNGSQFFIMLEDYPLPHNYTIFGKVIKGQEVVDAIGNVETDTSDKPASPVVIERVTVEEK